jgi:hypothetical protein
MIADCLGTHTAVELYLLMSLVLMRALAKWANLD